MTPSLHAERRRFTRVPLDASVRAEKIPQPFPNRVWHLLSGDASETGLRLSSPEFFPVETRLLINLDTEMPADQIRAVGKVVWVSQVPHQDQWNVGVELSNLSDSGRSRLRRMMVEQQAAGELR